MDVAISWETHQALVRDRDRLAAEVERLTRERDAAVDLIDGRGILSRDQKAAMVRTAAGLDAEGK